MKAKVLRWYDHERSKNYNFAVYWTNDPDQYPQDYDLFLTPGEWKKLSGLTKPHKGKGAVVEISVKLLEEFKDTLESE